MKEVDAGEIRSILLSRTIFYSACVLAAIVLHSAVYAQDELRLLGADTLTNEEINGHIVRKLIGNVAVQQGVITLYSDQVSHIPDFQRWTFEGHVRIVDPEKEVRSRYIVYEVAENKIYFRDSLAVYRGTAVLTAQRGVYYPKEKMYSCAGLVQFERQYEHLDADSALYYEKNEIIQVFGRVIYINTRDKVRLRGGYGKFYPNQDYGLITLNPSVVFEDSSSSDSTWIAGKVMEHFGKDRRFRVSDSVRIHRGNLFARCDTAWYHRSTSEVQLLGTPVIHQEDKTVNGESVVLNFNKSKIEKMVATGKARATMLADSSLLNSQQNVLEGSKIVIQFVDNKVSQMTAIRNARSTYYVVENKECRGANMVMGESISLEFSGSKLSKVKVEGGSEGLFYPPSLIGSMPKEEERKAP